MASDAEHRIEEHIQRGRLTDARDETLALLATTDDPGTALLAAVLECQLEQFEGAATLLRKVADDNPNWRNLCHEVGLCVDAEAERAQRRADPDAAAQRAGIGPPPPYAQAQLEALVYHTSGNPEAAARMIALAEEQMPALVGRVIKVDGSILPFTRLRDSDDLIGAMLEGI